MSWERLERVITWAGLSKHAFATSIGLTRSENIYRVIRLRKNITYKLANLIVAEYPQINREWLIHGDGQMIVDNDLAIPFSDKMNNSTLPFFGKVDRTILCGDDSMSPLIPVGAIILLQKQQVIVFGRIYLIETEDLSVVRIVRKNPLSDDEIIVESTNDKRYDSMAIQKSSIKNLYLACGIVHRFL